MIDSDFIVPKQTNTFDPLKKPHLAMAIGPTGSGKSTALFNYMIALQDKNDFKNILFVTSNGKDPLLSTLDPKVKIITQPDDLDLWIKARRQVKKPKQELALLVLDDIQSSPRFSGLFNKNSAFMEFMLSHRHFHTSILATTQTWKNAFHPNVRKQATRLFVFRPRDEDEMKAILTASGNTMRMKQAMELLALEPPQSFINLYKNPNTGEVQYLLGFKKLLEF